MVFNGFDKGRDLFSLGLQRLDEFGELPIDLLADRAPIPEDVRFLHVATKLFCFQFLEAEYTILQSLEIFYWPL